LAKKSTDFLRNKLTQDCKQDWQMIWSTFRSMV